MPLTAEPSTAAFYTPTESRDNPPGKNVGQNLGRARGSGKQIWRESESTAFSLKPSRSTGTPPRAAAERASNAGLGELRGIPVRHNDTSREPSGNLPRIYRESKRPESRGWVAKTLARVRSRPKPYPPPPRPAEASRILTIRVFTLPSSNSWARSTLCSQAPCPRGASPCRRFRIATRSR